MKQYAAYIGLALTSIASLLLAFDSTVYYGIALLTGVCFWAVYSELKTR